MMDTPFFFKAPMEPSWPSTQLATSSFGVMGDCSWPANHKCIFGLCRIWLKRHECPITARMEHQGQVSFRLPRRFQLDLVVGIKLDGRPVWWSPKSIVWHICNYFFPQSSMGVDDVLCVWTCLWDFGSCFLTWFSLGHAWMLRPGAQMKNSPC